MSWPSIKTVLIWCCSRSKDPCSLGNDDSLLPGEDNSTLSKNKIFLAALWEQSFARKKFEYSIPSTVLIWVQFRPQCPQGLGGVSPEEGLYAGVQVIKGVWGQKLANPGLGSAKMTSYQESQAPSPKGGLLIAGKKTSLLNTGYPKWL